MKSFDLHRTLKLTVDYFDGRKVGCFGNAGYRKTTDLSKFRACIEDLTGSGIIRPRSAVFADLGCGDGRVNLLMSYFVRLSIGIEIDSEILSEYGPRKNELFSILKSEGAVLPPENIFLFQGSSLDDKIFDEIRSRTGVDFGDVDLFYTYITLHDVFAEKIAERGRPGAYYLVYGFSRVLPGYESLELVNPDVGARAIAALFRKKG
jgi:SAM-dependent methyltransferase